MRKTLHIAIIADPELPIPPILYGGIERIIDLLIKGYLSRGHQVSLFAHQDSLTAARLYPYQGKTSGGKLDFLRNIWRINKTILSEKFDIVHSFGRLSYLLPQLPFRTIKLMSYQREPTIEQIKKALSLARKGSLAFTGCSDYISKKISQYAPAYTVYNGVPLSTYTFNASVEPDAALVFLGRIEPIKGAHIAIQTAMASHKKLIIAGNIPDAHSEYFVREIAPYLNEQIKYVGEVDDHQKNELLGKALALLMPVTWDEPFGIVMAEAMACGTPVIGFKRGAVPEVLRHGINGFLCSSTGDMIRSIQHIHEIDRSEVRKDAEKRFSSDVIVQKYLEIYDKLIKA